VSAPGDVDAPPIESRPRAAVVMRWLDAALRGFGEALAVWGALLVAAYGAFLSAFRVGPDLVPIALPIAVVGNAALIWFAYRVSGHKLFALVPGFIWIIVTFAWSSRTTEGDLVLYQSNWVATVYLLVGSATIGICAYRLFIPRRPPSPSR